MYKLFLKESNDITEKAFISFMSFPYIVYILIKKYRERTIRTSWRLFNSLQQKFDLESI